MRVPCPAQAGFKNKIFTDEIAMVVKSQTEDELERSGNLRSKYFTMAISFADLQFYLTAKKQIIYK